MSALALHSFLALRPFRRIHAAPAWVRWPALFLQWRRHPKLVSAARIVARAKTAATPWHTTIHLHLTSIQTFGQAPLRSAQAAAAPEARRRVAAGTVFRAAALPSGAQAGAPQLRAPAPSVRATLLWSRRRLLPTASAAAPRWPAHDAPPLSSDDRRPPLQSSKGPAALTWMATAAACVAAMGRATAPRSRPPTSIVNAMRASLSPAAPMLWRKADVGQHHSTGALAYSSATPGAEAFSAGTFYSTQAPAPAGTTAAVAAPAPVAPMSGEAARAMLRAAALDPALVDRLADDVIRRVERSMRIERERRGV
jgi:hypothetical protein